MKTDPKLRPPAEVLAEYDNGAAVDSPSREYIYSGAAQIAKLTGSTATYYHQDHLSTRLTTGSAGTASEQLGHFPFGESWYDTGGEKWKFTTYERDGESGNDYAMARFHVNRLGRFSSADPLSGSIGDPQSLNHYPYAGNDPINYADPTGMSETRAQDICGAGPYRGYFDQTCAGEDWAMNGGLAGGGGIDFNHDGLFLQRWDPFPWDAYPTSNFIGLQPPGEQPPDDCDGPNPPLVCAPYDMSEVSKMVPSRWEHLALDLLGMSSGGGGIPLQKKPFKPVFDRLRQPTCGKVFWDALSHGFNQASSPLSPSGGSPEELMATGSRAVMSQYVVARGLAVPLRSSIYRALGAVAEGIEIIPIGQAIYALGYADVKLYVAKFQDRSCQQ